MRKAQKSDDVRKLSLRPYHGEIHLCRSAKSLRKHYEKLAKQPYPFEDDDSGGRYIVLDASHPAGRVFLVWGSERDYLAHEFAHVLLIVFKTIGHDPTEGDGEPFCYMLSQLLLESQ